MTRDTVPETTDGLYDVAVIGAGPGGLSAALNLVRARRRTIVLDGNRPRNAATFHSHGFITRDGVSPLELRGLAREELKEYPNYEYHQTMVASVAQTDEGFLVATKGPGFTTTEFRARTIVIATGVSELMPALPTLRAFYGTSIHSCIECDGYEERDKAIAILGDTDDLAERAILASQWSSDVIVFAGATGGVTDDEESELAARGIRVDRRTVVDVVGDRTGLTGILLDDGETVARDAAFVRPIYEPRLGYLESLGLVRAGDGYLAVDAEGRTSLTGVYAAGDSASPGPRQLIVAAGQGARVASALNRDLLSVRPAVTVTG
ncbi:NAD(P)/FAD-dependent oxidoreductase [Marisediminicola antarctica]|uniref:Pyridine nucleotide-disulfide oxidoreductase n=1 Tax=Marisediminicola antarctica TaxID=674079 RepID=A0A7L5AQU8_9MICO|nr:NAD(P)/FAD-dependent oxidoreductase [Marisediminicola antarctica]QHO70749.1 pyridine nucleotide-disulfide oxidoreductase [Marisediminicola antarctica]